MTTDHDDDVAALAGLSPSALLILSGAGQVRYANPAAHALLRSTEMLSTASGTLTARRKAEDRELRDALGSLSPALQTAVVCLRTRESCPVLVVDLHQLPSGQVACRLTPTAYRPAPSPDRLRSLFALTRAEARVAAAMLSGLGLQAIAARSGVEPETVRSQAKRIRAKAGARSQSELLGVLWATGPELGAHPDGQPGR